MVSEAQIDLHSSERPMTLHDSIAVWPPSNPAAEALLCRFFDRVAPGWSHHGQEQPLTFDEFVAWGWAWAPRFEDVTREPVDLSFAEEADGALLELADGVSAPFNRLSRGARAILCARCAVAIARAQGGIVDPDAIMFLPAGLSEDNRHTAATIRLLYATPTAL